MASKPNRDAALETLRHRANALPAVPGVYLYRDGAGKVIYVGKAKSLRDRVRNYFLEERLAEVKTGTLMAEAAGLDHILTDNEKEALALENNLIKQYQPRYNVLLRDDKTYPYIKYTATEKHPRVYVTRRLKKDGSLYFGPYFPANLAYRLVNFIHRRFQVPSCKVDLTRYHTHPCLEYHIHRCLGPCVQGLTTDEAYSEATREVKLFLEGRRAELARDLRARMQLAADRLEFERAAALRDLLSTLEEFDERQKIAAAEGQDADIFGCYAEPPLVAVNLFHLRKGRVVDRREFFWEDQLDFSASDLIASLLKQLYIDQHYVPAQIHVPAEFDDREALEEYLSERRGRRVEILTPQRGQKRAMIELVARNARTSFEQRFRVLKPSSKQIVAALEEALGLPEITPRIECLDISHLQGTDTVASMVAWENGRMKRGDYRKFIIRTVEGSDDLASMREVVTRRYSRLQQENQPLPGLVLIDGGLGQLHAAAQALEALGIINQPLAAIAKREEIIYVYGQESEPVVLDRFSPILHLIQQIRDEAHRFAVTFHRSRRDAARLTSELTQIPGVGPRTIQKLLKTFGSLEAVRTATPEALAAAVGPVLGGRISGHFVNSAAPVAFPGPAT
jgi:excinuclease ABC subunit C